MSIMKSLGKTINISQILIYYDVIGCTLCNCQKKLKQPVMLGSSPVLALKTLFPTWYPVSAAYWKSDFGQIVYLLYASIFSYLIWGYQYHLPSRVTDMIIKWIDICNALTIW